jgi:hypothetical protein
MLLAPLVAADRVLDERPHHLRSGDQREWSDFPQTAEGKRLNVVFNATANATEQTIRLRHRDVKQTWDVVLNDRKLGPLPQDENATLTYIAVPPNTLRAGENVLSIVPGAGASDDIEVSDIRVIDHARKDVLTESRLNVRVTDAETNRSIPCRITVTDEQGSLVTLGTTSAAHLAIRPGVVYTATGDADVQLPAGRYTIYATRGFEWGLDQSKIELAPGQTLEKTLSIRREVPTPGYVAVDTHCHTFTYARHGDATLAERMITIPGEGIELAVATDHNLYVNYDKPAREAAVRPLFTPVIGNEVTTPALGHFNVFPIPDDAKAMNFRAPDTELLFKSIDAHAGPDAVVVLNHARDVHGGFRPFDPKHHVSLTGQTLIPWRPRFNAMEVINSGATRTDTLGLVQDWLGLLNAGRRVAPIGASDSHDVSRYILGQGRTYVRCNDSDPGNIDVAAACKSIREGRVLVSYGLLADIRVNDLWTVGDTATGTDGDLAVTVRVLGPSWTSATQVKLYANGRLLRSTDVPEPQRAGTKLETTWKIPRPRHDVQLVAVATGPGVTEPYWPFAKPYQPTSPDYTPTALAVTGAVFIDADASGTFDSPRDYAARILEKTSPQPAAVAEALAEYDDDAVAAQAAAILVERDRATFDAYCDREINAAPPHVQRAWGQVRTALDATKQ